MRISYLACLICLSLPLAAQVKTSGAATSAHTELRQRYDALVCAIVLIQTERGTGTGFFVDSQGDMVTAAHVISTKAFKMAGGQIDFDIKVDQRISISPHGQPKSPLPVTGADIDKRESATDLLFLHTTIHPPCFIPLGKSGEVSIGDHLLSIGFPGIDNGNPVLYEGFLSGRFPHPPNVALAVIGNQTIMPSYEVLKVQMPITSGASGSPIIDDSGHAVGVISESPIIWTQDLDNITRVAGTGSGVTMSGFDAVKILGQLAVVVREFESPGSGYAVPISGLNPKRAEAPPSSKLAH